MSNQRGGPADGADANGAHRPVSLTLVPKAAERQSTKEFKSDQEVRWCPGCGNHLIHALRRNVNVKILLFNNRIYGLTKGQYSPTSEQGKVTKSTPFGSLDTPFNPVSLALGAEASFVARTIDSDRKHLTGVLRAAADHRGAAFVEIYQNCPIFNDDAFALSRLDRADFAHTPIGVFRQQPRASYDDLMAEQISAARARRGEGDLAE